MAFIDLISNPELLKALEEMGYKDPTPIQAQAIPEVMKGSDLRASAQTGTGKTAAFLLPTLMRLAVPSTLPGRGPRALILVPTRELAVQVANEAKKYSKYLARAKTVCIYGGTPYQPQFKELARPFDILVATPGRLIDHFEQKRIDFSRVEVFILDEADRMLDMGFIEPVETIAASLPETRQTLLFSATMKGSVMNLSRRLLKNPVEIVVEAAQERHDHIDQIQLTVDSLDQKTRLLEHLLNDASVAQAIVFTATKHQADHLADKLSRLEKGVGVLHGGMKQSQRTRTLMQLRRNEVSILIATDVAARGIDIPTISHVINFDLPNGVEDYVHRIGRTGRAGATGVAYSLVKPNEFSLVKRIERYTGYKIRVEVIPGFEPRNRHEPSRSGAPYRSNNRPFTPARREGWARNDESSAPSRRDGPPPRRGNWGGDDDSAPARRDAPPRREWPRKDNFAPARREGPSRREWTPRREWAGSDASAAPARRDGPPRNKGNWGGEGESAPFRRDAPPRREWAKGGDAPRRDGKFKRDGAVRREGGGRFAGARKPSR